MYDGFKLLIRDPSVIDELIESPNWIDEINSSSGELLYKTHLGKYGLKYRFSVKQSTLIIEGSLTKFYQGQNITDLSSTQIAKAVDLLGKELHCDPGKIEVKNLEYGICLPFEIGPDEFIRNIISQRSKAPGKVLENNNGVYKLFEKDGKSLKIYDKSAYEKIKEAMLRIELRLKRTRLLSSMGISRLADLKKKRPALLLRNALLQEWRRLLVVDPLLDIPAIKNLRDRNFMFQFRSEIEWKKVKSATTRSRRRAKFDAITLQYVPEPTKLVLEKKMAAKLDQLIES